MMPGAREVFSFLRGGGRLDGVPGLGVPSTPVWKPSCRAPSVQLVLAFGSIIV